MFKRICQRCGREFETASAVLNSCSPQCLREIADARKKIGRTTDLTFDDLIEKVDRICDCLESLDADREFLLRQHLKTPVIKDDTAFGFSAKVLREITNEAQDTAERALSNYAQDVMMWFTSHDCQDALSRTAKDGRNVVDILSYPHYITKREVRDAYIRLATKKLDDSIEKTWRDLLERQGFKVHVYETLLPEHVRVDYENTENPDYTRDHKVLVVW